MWKFQALFEDGALFQLSICKAAMEVEICALSPAKLWKLAPGSVCLSVCFIRLQALVVQRRRKYNRPIESKEQQLI
jgi:hypothetical protein